MPEDHRNTTSERRLAAIMFTDIVGYTALMGDDEDKAFEILKKNRQIQGPLIEKYKGECLKEIGDGILASFNTVSDAVKCAKEIQEVCEKEKELNLRIGIYQGEVVFEGTDVFGDGVNIASRLETLAPLGGIYVSESVFRNIENKKGIETQFVSEQVLKNVKHPVRIYEIKTKQSHPSRSSTQSTVPNGKTEHPINKLLKRSGLIVMPLILIIALLFYFFNDRFSKEEPVFNPEKDLSIAILPFRFIGENDESSWIADGLTEEVRKNISRIPNIKVAPSLSSSHIYNQDLEDLELISEKLDTKYLLRGSLQIIEDNARLNVSLIDVEDDRLEFEESYGFILKDIFDVQRNIANQVAVRIRPTFVTFLESEKDKEVNEIAYEHYLKGKYMWATSNVILTRKIIESHFLEAIRIDSDFSLPYAGLSELYLNLAHSGSPGNDVFPKSIEYAKKCMALDSNSFLSLSAYADCQYHFNYAWEVSESYFNKAFEINPYYTSGLLYYAGMLSAMNRHNEALETIERAIKADPYNLLLIRWKIRTLYWARAFEKANNYYLEIVNIYSENPETVPWMEFPEIHTDSDALSILEKQTAESTNNINKVGLVIAYIKNENLKEAKEIYDQIFPDMINSSPSYLAKIDVYLGNYDHALEVLEHGYEIRDAALQWINADIAFDPIREDPRFQQIIKNMNLADHPPF